MRKWVSELKKKLEFLYQTIRCINNRPKYSGILIHIVNWVLSPTLFSNTRYLLLQSSIIFSFITYNQYVVCYICLYICFIWGWQRNSSKASQSTSFSLQTLLLQTFLNNWQLYFLWHFVLLLLGHKYPVVYIDCVIYVLKKCINQKFKFTNFERLTYFMKSTIQHVIYVIKQLVSPKMFTNESLFTIQRLLY